MGWTMTKGDPGEGIGRDDIDSMDSGLTVGCPSNTMMELGLRSTVVQGSSAQASKTGLDAPPPCS